ncbi:MAG TPA: hypothetical protein VL490_10845 [Mucilaginibacter sp.]|jgi:hypothetical protein|nr:hypothetical protein [Mucilaginibacter sp.]
MKIKFLTVLFAVTLSCQGIFAQDNDNSPKLPGLAQTIKDYAQNPAVLNNAAAKLLSVIKDTAVVDFVRDLNINFKTFQADNQPASLGFTYKYENSWTWGSKKHDFTNSLSVDMTGNVAFKKIYNPANFLQSKIGYSGNFFWGGVVNRNTDEEAKELLQANRDKINALRNHDQAKADAAQAKMDQLYNISDQFFISLNASPAYESNQDFSKQQFAPGAFAVFGVNGYSKKSNVGWYNLPDYPFALIRLLTGTDSKLHPSGATVPTLAFGLDYVVPTQDSLRNAVAGQLNPFSRVRFEAAFKTTAARVDDQVIYFTADYRWYQELNASAAIKAAGIAKSNYFVAALEASNGFFASYATGHLPFDQKSTQVYALGFKYNLGNWKTK